MDNPNYAIWLYGSHSRGNHDSLSDVDVLLVTDDEMDDISLRELPGFPKTPTVSRYIWDEVERMAEYGSLFLRHIALEGRPIFESAQAIGRLRALLLALGPYQLAARDLHGFQAVHCDVSESLYSGGASLIFEIATLATVFRHTCILGCNLSGVPCFSRVEPVRKLVRAWSLPEVWADDFPCLYRYRLYADGRVMRVKSPSTDYAWAWHERTGVLLSELRRRISG